MTEKDWLAASQHGSVNTGTDFFHSAREQAPGDLMGDSDTESLGQPEPDTQQCDAISSHLKDSGEGVSGEQNLLYQRDVPPSEEGGQDVLTRASSTSEVLVDVHLDGNKTS